MECTWLLSVRIENGRSPWPWPKKQKCSQDMNTWVMSQSS